MQAVANGIPDLLVSGNGTRAPGLLFCLRKILIDAEFALSSVGQGVCIQGRGISKQGFVDCRPIHRRTILSWMIRSGLNFEVCQRCGNCWLIQKKTLASWDAGGWGRPYHETKRRRYDQLGQLDPQVRGDSQLVHQECYGKRTRGGKMPSLIVVMTY